MTVLVTGAAGFIGFNLCRRLAKEGNEVIAVDSISDYYSTDLKELRLQALLNNPNVKFERIDLVERANVESLIESTKPQTVIHLAAQAGVRLPESQFYKYVDANLTGFSNILNSAIESKVPNFLYASSSSVYGNSEKYPFSESDSNLCPISFYGATKLSNEYMAKSMVRGSLTKARGLRFFTVYGPWGRPDMAYFRIANSLINEKVFRLFGDGDAIRDFTFIDDTTKATIELGKDLSTRTDPGYFDIVNIGGGSPHSMKDLIREFETVSNQKLKIEYTEKIEKDVNLTIADPTYLKKLTDFTPQISLKVGVQKFFDWAKDVSISPKLDSWYQSVKE